MALLRRNDPDEQLGRRSEKTLRSQLAEAQKRFREFEAIPNSQVVREGRVDEALGGLREAAAAMSTIGEELARRDCQSRALRSRALRAQDPVNGALEWAAVQLTPTQS
jgi:hypothetical protein